MANDLTVFSKAAEGQGIEYSAIIFRHEKISNGFIRADFLACQTEPGR
jgi:hypothetical protein